ncbi:carboxylesterase/lipase family protein [Sinorhizobium meliloti]|uniref:carboxylesterase/lipase family protein n=1 Tax=Rhizobium meliloti TaxID=382 RepID=UPI003F18C59B
MARTEGGDILGYATDRLKVFKGIPYGGDTTGPARFKAPGPVTRWEGMRVARAVGDPCYQVNDDWKGWTDNRNGSEDCLRLNVWAPIGAARKPVMVFFHGGGYKFGSGGAPLYDGGHLAERGDVVVVTVNHRLHVLGFAFLNDLAPEAGFAANTGLLDLVQALTWVKNNIAGFGGDPENVTIFGESGGGGKVSCLMAMPKAKGLFHRAIIQSGAQRRLRTRDEATEDALALLKQLGLGKQDIGKLPSVAVDELYTAYKKVAEQRTLGRDLTGPFCPVLDGDTLPWHPSDDEALELSRSVDKMYGTNTHEALYYLDFAGLLSTPTNDEQILADAKAYLKKLPPEKDADLRRILDEYKAQFAGDSPDQLKVRLLSDLWMASDTVQKCTAESSLGSGAPVYHYVFTWEEPYKGKFWSVHGAELLFVFDNVDADEMWGESGAPLARANRDPEGDRYRLRDNVVSAWSSFARTGNPVLNSGETWPAFEPTELKTMVLGESSDVKSDYYGSAIRDLFKKIDCGIGT